MRLSSAHDSSSRRAAARRRRRRAPGSRSRRTRSASGGTRRPGCGRSRRRDASSSRGASSAVKIARDDGVGILEEVVDDLDLARARAQAGDRVDDLLRQVLLLDDLGRVAAEQRVRLVVEHERPRRPRARARRAGRSRARRRARTRTAARAGRRGARRCAPRAPSRVYERDEVADPRQLVVGDGRIPVAHERLELRRRSGAAGAARSTSSSSRCTASPISVGCRPPSPVAPGAPLPRRGLHARDALGVVAVAAAVEQGDRAVGEPRDAARTAARGISTSSRSRGAGAGISSPAPSKSTSWPSSSPGLRPPRPPRGRLRRRREAVDPQHDAGVAALDLDRRRRRRRGRAPPRARAARAPSRSASARRARFERSTEPDTISRSIARVIAT